MVFVNTHILIFLFLRSEFLEKGANQPINIDTKTMSIVRNNMSENPSRFTFEAAFEHIYTLMKKDSYRRFLLSRLYKSAVSLAVDPVPPKPR